MDKNIVKRFTEASGKFELYEPYDSYALHCFNCTELSTCEHNLAMFKNPAYIMAVIQSWTCDNCGGKSFIHNEGPTAECFDTSRCMASCTNGKVDWREDFEAAIYNKIFDSLTDCCDVSDGNIDLGWVMVNAVFMFSSILLNPTLLMSEFLEFMGIEIEGSK